MSDTVPGSNVIRTFDDLENVPDDVLKQVATRVHVIDLAYAFRDADALRDRLFASIRPELAEEIRSAMRTADWASERMSPDDQTRSSRARVVEVARSEVDH